MRQELCICPAVEDFRKRLQPQTRVSVLMHHREEHLTTNTAQLAAQLLPNCEVFIRGKPDAALDPSQILRPGETPLLLYPSENAQVLTREFVQGLKAPFCLIVPDGSWRQASKVAKREAFLADIPRVVLKADAPTRYRLRREPKTEGLATFEAIARALGVLEGPKVREEMEKVFELMVNRTMRSREGRLPIVDD